ncbi:MAG TPA: glycosyltransferase family 4 protein [Coleofasciculaceae cyanobacterium]
MTTPTHWMSLTVQDLRVALVATGLSHVQRGYESFVLDLYEALKDVADVTLFKGSGPDAPPNVYTVPTLRRNAPLVQKLCPNDESKRYLYEQISTALSGWALGYWKNYSVIHFCDPTFGNVLNRLKKQFNYDYQLLFANCGPFQPEDYRQFDHIQEFTPLFLEQAKGTIRKTRLHLNPMGIWTERFRTDSDQAALRREFDIPQDKFVILCVASLDDPAKRIRFLIDAVAGLNDDRIHLVLAGQNENTPYAQGTLAEAEAKLSGRFRYVAVPSLRIAEIYNASDLFILPSLQEGFGKVYLEAMASRMPLLVHNYPNTQWIVKTPESLIDMEDMGALQAAIALMRDESGTGLSDLARSMAEINFEWVNERFHWKNLRDEYLQMYERILLLPA